MCDLHNIEVDRIAVRIPCKKVCQILNSTE
jgi:hypothetical protein